jgi:hypothetical protein
MLKKNLLLALAALLWLAVVPGASVGEGPVIDPNTLGAAIAAPYLTDTSGRLTVVTVTNGSNYQAVTLHILWISGTDWSGIDYDCPLTPLETTYFTIEAMPDSDNALVTFECSDLGLDVPRASATSNIVRRAINGRRGVMFVTLECQIGDPQCDRSMNPVRRTIAPDILSADLSVIDFAQGVAVSAPAIHIQSVPDGDASNNDRRYSFSGLEEGDYKQFPSLLTANYVAPDDSITAELLVFTLDGVVGSGPGISAQLNGFAFDDDENPASGSMHFDCLDVLPIDGSPNGFGLNVNRTFSGHLVGHLQLFPAIVARQDVLELQTRGNDGLRRAPVHGYILQTIQAGGRFAAGDYGGTMAASGFWMRQLTQGTNPLVPFRDDEPQVDARTSGE